MKKYSFFLVISCSILLALFQAGATASGTWGFEKVAVAQETQYSEALHVLPHTALDFHADGMNVHSGGLHRHQKVASFLAVDGAISHSFRALNFESNKSLRHFFNKSYLAHNYPSHHFW